MKLEERTVIFFKEFRKFETTFVLFFYDSTEVQGQVEEQLVKDDMVS